MSTKGKEIDKLISQQYKNKRYSELNALSKLFSSNFLSKLPAILEKGKTRHDSLRYSFEINHGWIDKIPLAEFVKPTYDHFRNQIGKEKRVELGDMLVIYNYYNKCYDQNEKRLVKRLHCSRALLIQAKISKKRNPNVPISYLSPTNPNNSTNKELALMSNWPEFILYKAPRSKQPLLKSLDINSDYTKALFAGFYSKTWDTGIPVHDAPCNRTLGVIFEELVNRNIGEECSLTNPNSDWDKLICEIINITKALNAPKSMERTGKRFIGSNIPLLFFFFFDFLRPKPKFHVIEINEIMEEGTHLKDDIN